MTVNPIRCPDDEILGTWLDLPEADARHRHLEACVHCRARVDRYRSFMKGLGEEALRREEAARLAELRARLTGASSGLSAVPPVTRPAVPGSPRRAPRGIRAWFTPAWRPALGAAAVAVVVLGLLYRPGVPLRREAPAVRGPVASEPGRLSVQPLAGGVTRFSWTAHPEAERYELQVLSASLTLLARFDAGSNTVLELPADSLPEAHRRGEAVLVRVATLVGADEIHTGGSLPLPGKAADPR